MNRIPGKTILWSEVMFDRAVTNFNKNKKEPVSEKQYLAFKKLHQNVYDDANDLVNKKLITFFDGIRSMCKADNILKTIEYKA